MRIVLSTNRKVAFFGVPLAVAAAIALTACGSHSKQNNVVDAFVPCDQVAGQLTAAQASVTSAQASASTADKAVSNKKGTPAENDAKTAQSKASEAVSQAIQQANNLSAKQVACSKTSSAPVPSGSKTAAPCTTNVVKLQSNPGANLFTHALSPKSEQARQQVLAVAGQDPRVFQVYYNASPLGNKALNQSATPFANTTDIAPIKNGGCYTARGQAAYTAWSVLWKLTKITTAALPKLGTNTGAPTGSPAFQQTGVIPSGHGYYVVYYDATGKIIGSHWVRQECGNVVTTTTIALPPKPAKAPPIIKTVVKLCFYLHNAPVTQPQNGLCEKLGNSEPLTVPVIGQKHYPSGDNGGEISQGPVQPVDSGNGIPSGATTGPSAPRSTPAAAPTHVSGTATMSSSPTQPAAPPSNTAVASGSASGVPTLG